MAAPSLRTETAGLVRLANRDLAALWRMVAAGASAEVALRDLLPAIIEEYGVAGGAMAADWYDALRDKAGARGHFSAFPVAASDRGAQSLIGWALDEASSDVALQALVAGGVQRRIADHVRQTLIGSALADPGADGWQRVGDGSSCPFCSMLIGRGAVYGEDTVDFGAHDNCGCSVTPAFSGQPRPVREYKRSARYIEDDERRAKANARTREWMRGHGYLT